MRSWPGPRLPMLLFVAAYATTAPLAAQLPDTAATAGRAATRPRIGSFAEERARTRQDLGEADPSGFLLRSPSLLLGEREPGWRLVEPDLLTVWNSDIPRSLNDGALWAGRGWSSALTAGVRGTEGPLSITLAPTLLLAQNRAFETLPPDIPGAVPLLAPWRVGRYSADLPLRFGRGRVARLDWGESSLVLRAKPVDVGLATEGQWWGPAAQNAIVLSNNAGGFPHLFLRSSSPLVTKIGSFEGKWLIGALSNSRWFNAPGATDTRSLSGFVATYRPRPAPDVTVGVARVVYASVNDAADLPGHVLDVFTTGRGNLAAPGDTVGLGSREQITSFFGRWIFPANGLELYAEWARTELPGSVRDFLTEPYHSQGYTLGFQWAQPTRDASLLRLRAELTDLEQSSSARFRYQPFYYVSAGVPQGYTQRGQTLGAAIGPGASSQWIAGDYLAPRWEAGVFGGRIRWDSDAYYTRANLFFGRDVSVYGGVRGGVRLASFDLDATLTTTQRYNYLFQNRSTDGSSTGAVDVHNYTLEVRMTPR